MFKSAIKSLTSAVVGATKETVKQYLPHVENEGDSVRNLAINTIIQGGIARIAQRSPILSDIAQNTFKIHQVERAKKQKVSEYVKSSNADWLRPVVKDSLGSNASDKKINDEMVRVISKISKEIDRVGADAVKKSGQFKEYEKYFDQHTNKHKEKSTTDAPTGTTSGTGYGLEEEILDRIESNTRQTVNALESLSVGGSIGGSIGGSTSGNGKPSFIDPYTGMPSIRAGVGSIGGSFLGKVFDDDTIEKFAKKAKSFIFGGNEEHPQPNNQNSRPQSETPKTKKPQPIRKTKKRGMGKVVSTMFEKDLFDLDSTTRQNYVPNIDANNQDNTTESSRELNKERADVGNKQQETSEKILEELKHLNKTTEKQADEKVKKSEKQGDKSGTEKSILDKGKETLLKRLGSKYLPKLLPRGAAKLAERVLGGQGGRVLAKVVGRVVPALVRAGAGGVVRTVAGRVVPALVRAGAGGVVRTVAGRVVPALVRAGAGSIIPSVARFAVPLIAGAGGALAGAAGALAGGGVLAAGAVAAGAAGLGLLGMKGVDMLAGAAGVGGNNINETKDDANWKNMSFAEKLESGVARGVEKVGDVLPMGNFVNEAKAKRIKAESEYLDKKNGVSANLKPPKPIPTPTQNTNSVAVNNESKISELNKINAVKTQKETESKNQPPVVINNNSGGGSGGSGGSNGSSNTTIAASSVRNRESTFERVQMQDFWSRAA